MNAESHADQRLLDGNQNIGEGQGGLWQKVLEDDTSAFERVVEHYQNLVASVAYSATGSFVVSEEVTQETFWQAWRQRYQLRDHGRLASWLCGIARNLAVQATKKEHRLPTLDLIVDPGSSVYDPAVNSISAEEHQLVWESLEEIPELYREALILYYREEHSMLEVASALDISSDAAKQRVHRGRDLLRDTLATRIEEVLILTRPSRSLTTRVMVGLAALGASLKATSTASAATSCGLAATALKSAVAGTSTGMLGGLLGTLGGLGGAFLGCWLPSQMAETMAERQLLEKHGRRSFIAAVIFAVAMFLLSLLFLVPNGRNWAVGFCAAVTIVFVVSIVIFGIRGQDEIKQLRASLTPDAQPNPSPLRRRFRLDELVYLGKRYTSRWRLLGLPLIDIQFGDVFGKTDQQEQGAQQGKGPLQAIGWIAIGDRATGVLFAAGGMAKGLIALGGLAIGGIAVGGGAVGALAIGGGALGGMAFGGLAVGYEAVGGLAIAWHVATGGGAIANYLAVGGGAWAHDFAVGGQAWAKQVNTEAAKQLASSLSEIWMLEWLARNRVLFFVATLLVSSAPAMLHRLAYRRCERNQARHI